DGSDLDPRIFLFEVGGKAVDDLGDRPADGDRIVERHFDRRLREGKRRRECEASHKRADDGFERHGALLWRVKTDDLKQTVFPLNIAPAPRGVRRWARIDAELQVPMRAMSHRRAS